MTLQPISTAAPATGDSRPGPASWAKPAGAELRDAAYGAVPGGRSGRGPSLLVGGLLVGGVEVQAAPDQYAAVLAGVIDAIGQVAAVEATQALDSGRAAAVRAGLRGGARLLVLVGPVTRPESRAACTAAVTVFVEDPGDLPAGVVSEVVRAVERVPLTGLEWAELVAQMPLTAGLVDHVPAGCLSGVAPVFTVHHMTDFLVMLDAAHRMGVPYAAMTVLDKGYRYRHTHRVDAHLRRLGVPVWPWTQAADALGDHARRATEAGRRGLLVDDGGYTLPVLLRQRPDLVGCFTGLVEQTMSGITKLGGLGPLPVPVFSVAQSRLKATIESYGVADAAVRNVLALLPQEKFEGQPALVAGYGRIGQQVAQVLADRRMRVAVYDAQLVQLVAAHERGYLTGRSLPDLLRAHQPLLVFGCSGATSLRGEHAAALLRDCYLISTTSRAHEFAVEELLEEADQVSDAAVLGTRLHLPTGAVVTLVADGFPINFHYAESMPNKYADLVLACMLIGAATLASPDRGGFQPGHNLAATDAVLETCGVLERYYQRFGPHTTTQAASAVAAQRWRSR